MKRSVLFSTLIVLGILHILASAALTRFEIPTQLEKGINFFAANVWAAGPNCEGDMEGDGDLDDTDLAGFAADFGRANCLNDCRGDFDGDLDVDGSELTVIAADLGRTDCPPGQLTAKFSVSQSTGAEGDTAQIDVFFSRPYSGSLFFRPAGAADPGDYDLSCVSDGQGTLCNVAVIAADQVSLKVPVTDDSVIEPLEWLTLQIESGPRYSTAAPGEHRLMIAENDALWEGAFTSDQEQLGFTLAIRHQSTGAEASLEGNGVGIIPAGTFPVLVTLSDTLFSAVAAGVPLSASETHVQGDTTLSISLDADANEPNEVVTSNGIEGAAVLSIVNTRHTHLNRTVQGIFVLTRRTTAPDSTEVQLFEVLP